jgi:hexosaminidase
LLQPELLPLPQYWLGEDVPAGEITDSQTTLHWAGEFDARVADRVSALLGEAPCGNIEINIDLCSAAYPALDEDESYKLEVNAAGITLAAATTWGALHGITTLWQLSATGQLRQNSWRIEDSPRFSWRGVLIDVARHFMPLPLLLDVVEGMARLKMNVLHLHLTDDQGFRFTSVAYPKLASEQAYNAAELGELVAYAASHGVRVIPELDVPGHVTSWLVNYPEWGLQQVATSTKFGVHKACLDPTNESVYTALGTLFEELAEVFPDQYVHIGGDEVHPSWWSESAEIQNYIVLHGLEDVRGLQAHFNHRICTALTQQGKSVVGWDEVLHSKMPELVVQNWRGATTRDRALAKSLDSIVSAPYYLDLFYPADVYYRFDPEADQAQLIQLEEEMKEDLRLAHIATGLQWTMQWRDDAIEIDQQVGADLRGRVLGGEACLWAELVDAATLETRLWSRLPAVAERLWSSVTTVDVADFYRRLGILLELPEFELMQRQREPLQQLGLNLEQVEMAMLLEPVKWYARLLGEQALQARLSGREMPQARPYDVHSELDRVVDFIAPESLSALTLDGASEDELRRCCHGWVEQDPTHWPNDVAAAIAAMSDVGAIMLDVLDKQTLDQSEVESSVERLHACYTPRGEYMLAVVPPLIAWLHRKAASE